MKSYFKLLGRITCCFVLGGSAFGVTGELRSNKAFNFAIRGLCSRLERLVLPAWDSSPMMISVDSCWMVLVESVVDDEALRPLSTGRESSRSVQPLPFWLLMVSTSLSALSAMGGGVSSVGVYTLWKFVLLLGMLMRLSGKNILLRLTCCSLVQLWSYPMTYWSQLFHINAPLC